MKVETDNDRVSLVLTPENDAELNFLRSICANAQFGSIEVQCHFRDLKTGSIGLRLYKNEQTILKVDTNR